MIKNNCLNYFSIMLVSSYLNGAMAELVDALVLGTNMATCEGSSPFRPTIKLL